MQKNLNVKTFDVSLEGFFKVWLQLLKPFHKMTNKEMEIVAYLLYRRHYLLEKVKDEGLVDKLLIDSDTRDEIKKKMGYSNNQVLSNMLSELRNKNILINDSVTKKLIPKLEENAHNFKLVFQMNITHETR